MAIKMTALDEWLKQTQTSLDPEVMQYRAKLGEVGDLDNCNGCCFKSQRSKVCIQASKVAARANLPDCDTVDPATGRKFVYYIPKRDPRQIDLVEQVKE